MRTRGDSYGISNHPLPVNGSGRGLRGPQTGRPLPASQHPSSGQHRLRPRRHLDPGATRGVRTEGRAARRARSSATSSSREDGHQHRQAAGLPRDAGPGSRRRRTSTTSSSITSIGSFETALTPPSPRRSSAKAGPGSSPPFSTWVTRPRAAMVESIIHAVDQYQSQASGADISYKMSERPSTEARSVGPARLPQPT